MDLITAMWLGIFTYAFLITCGLLVVILMIYVFYKLCKANRDNKYERDKYIEDFNYNRV